MTHDEFVYANPDLFYPERLLDENGDLNDDDLVLPFGFGRR
jgi:cytochrome P450